MRTRFNILLWLLAISQCSQAGSLDTWTGRVSGTTNNLNAIAYGAQTFVAVGDGGTILTSTNGADWASQNAGSALNLYGITYANGLFVAVGQGIRTSTDGITWSARFAPLNVLHGVTYGNGLFVAVGVNGTIGTSTDGTNWVAQNSGTSTLFTGIAYGNGVFVSLGNGFSGPSCISTNGTNWTTVSVGGLGFTFGQNKFVAVGGNFPAEPGGLIATSQDGSTWNFQYYGIYANFYGISWGNGSFVVVGGINSLDPSSTNRVIGTSPDALTWTTRLEDTNGPLASVAYGNGSFVAVGSQGVILQSGPIFTLAGQYQFPNDGFELDLTGEIGRSYRIQTSTNLADTNWTDLVTFTNTTETMQFLDADATNYSRCFYRAVSP